MYACTSQTGNDGNSDVCDQIVEMIIEKKTTRNNTFYKVSKHVVFCLVVQNLHVQISACGDFELNKRFMQIKA